MIRALISIRLQKHVSGGAVKKEGSIMFN